MFSRSLKLAGVIALLAFGVPAGAPPAYGQDGIDRMRIVGRNDIQYAHLMDFHIVGDYAYASNGYDGGVETYDITDPANPINTYGRTKLAGEQLLAQSGCRHCIIRVEWTYGSAGNNFVAKIIQRAKADKALKVVDDQIGSPTATAEAAKAICKLLRKKPEGIFHFANAGYVSRYDMAEFIFNKLSMDVNLLPCKTSDFPSPAARPLNSRFDCSKIISLLDEPIEFWQVSLERFLRQL